MNGGYLLVNGDDVLGKIGWTCIHPQGFTADPCNIKEREPVFIFHPKIELPPSNLSRS